MAFLMTVLAIHFIVKRMIDKSKPKNKDANKTEATGVKHPAELCSVERIRCRKEE